MFATKVKLITVLCVSSLISLNDAFDDENAWREYKIKFNKSYTSEAEELHRMNVFLDNLRYVESHNLKSKEKGQSFIQGVNHLSDLTTEEINKSRCGFRLLEDELEPRPTEGLAESLLLALNSTFYEFPNSTANEKAWYDSLVLPAKLDYRLTGRVSKVKDQGSCGSCWAVSKILFWIQNLSLHSCSYELTLIFSIILVHSLSSFP